MKRWIFVLMVFAAFSYAMAQGITNKNIPEAVKSCFKKLYPEVSAVKWEREAGNYEANFSQDHTAMSAVITPSGSLVETETSIPVSSLPQGVASYVAQHAHGTSIKEASKIVKAGGEVNYEAEVKGEDWIFGQDGKFIRVDKE